MIGKVCRACTKFVQNGITKTKARPVVVIGGPYENDYIVLPVSTITNRTMRNPRFDIEIPQKSLGILGLTKECFVRVHKQIPVHKASLLHVMGDIKSDLPDLYVTILEKLDEFHRELVEHSI